MVARGEYFPEDGYGPSRPASQIWFRSRLPRQHWPGNTWTGLLVPHPIYVSNRQTETFGSTAHSCALAVCLVRSLFISKTILLASVPWSHTEFRRRAT